MLSIGEDLVFVEMVHDVAVDYMLQYLACDGVPHQRLLHKLEYYGVKAKTKNWIQSFLQNRQQRVILEGAASEQTPVLSMISTCEPFSNFDAISWMATMSWDSHDRFLRNQC
jgi:hypothetical protein